MPILILVILLTTILVIYFKRKIDKEVKETEGKLKTFKDSLNKSLSKSHLLNEEIKDYEIQLERVISFYEVSKEISKSLERDTIFKLFKDNLKNHFEFSDCLLREEQEPIPNYEPFPLRIEKDKILFFYLKDLREEDKERFNILLNQFTLALRRSLLYGRLQELAIRDSLTGLFNRRYMLERCEDELKRSEKFNLNLSFLLADIDNFKSYNDRYGHLVGDQVLINLARIIKANIRLIDLAARYGGEEFLILLPDTSKENAFLVAERIRRAISEESIKAYDEILFVTASFGISEFPQDSLELTGLIDKADSALYRAKSEGRNKICVYNIS